MQADTSDLLTIREVMKLFHISRRTVYLWIDKKILSPVRIGGVIRFRGEDLRELVKKKSPHTASEGRISSEILVVDDDLLVRESFALILKRLGYEGTVVSSGEEAMQLLKVTDKNYQLVICDVRMPVLNGVQTLLELRQIRSKRKQGPMHELLMMGYADDQAFREARELGIKHLIKPFELHELDQKIHESLSMPLSAR